jgi:hypothetical protein
MFPQSFLFCTIHRSLGDSLNRTESKQTQIEKQVAALFATQYL